MLVPAITAAILFTSMAALTQADSDDLVEDKPAVDQIPNGSEMDADPARAAVTTSADEYAVLIMPNASAPGCEKDDTCLLPSWIAVKAGDTVTWNNTDTVSHTVTSGTVRGGPTGAFDSGLLQSGGQFSVTLDEPGAYEYYCIIHPWVAGEVAATGLGHKGAPEPATVEPADELGQATAPSVDPKPIEKQHCVEVAKREKPGKFTCFYTEKEANDFRDACSLYGPGKTIVCTRYYWVGSEAASACDPSPDPFSDACAIKLIYKRVD
ncbi:exported hypothetical protein [Nitrosopumilaceae archaeon]|nr:exported hypothetical protein [Nitrosopumilaceae archaeon]